MKAISRTSLWRIVVCGLLGVSLAGCGGDDGDTPIRTLHIVAPTGTFAYFQLLWPQVEVAQSSNAAFAVIEPASSGHLFAADANGNREWLATTYAPWIDQHGEPLAGMEISAFVSGTNQTHTQAPTSNYLLTSGNSNIAGIAAYQIAHGSYPAPLVVVGSGFVGTAPDAPLPAIVTDAAAMVGLYQSLASVDLTPTTAEETQFMVGSDAALADFGRRLIIAAKALRDGHSATIVVSMPGLDPHTAFTDIPALKARLQVIQAQLNGFRALLGHRMANHVVITINGDTPKTPLNQSGWADGTPSGVNWIYVVGKGMLKHGWFGRVHADGSASSYNAVTGADESAASSATRQYQTAAAIAYAGTGGDDAYVRDTLSGGEISTYSGVVR